MILKERIMNLATSLYEEVVAHRQHIHAHPELSFEEYNTAAYIRQQLHDMGIEPLTMANTGVVALIKGAKPSEEVIALRADIDALPIQEVAGREYGSKNTGIMHACGHDVHSSSLLGTAKILQALKNEFAGTVKLIFQPGEEKLPGGASILIKEGVLENPKPASILGQHVLNILPVGKVGFRSGKYMASTDELYVTVRGRGGHGAQPQQNVDPIVITANIITALQQIVSRMADPKMPTVLSFGRIEGLGATNVIPDEVKLQGTFRTFDETWRAEAHRRMKKLAEGMAESMGATCEFEVRKGYPFLTNEPALTAQCRSFAEEYLGEENIVDLDLWMAGEDFAYYSQVVDACFYRLGIRNEERGITSPVHTPNFDIDESALKLSTGLMAYMALKKLGN
ncbi:M20 metallopeptidase family protein [Olivibacter sitiensis]|uniref:M20 metallopeptidase family protein n=1 Tax=Olivibacter sitiensis TaxID=376470 RepID=UPI0005615A12|nr:amidohydrolase [Olivibacter sitiensis]